MDQHLHQKAITEFLPEKKSKIGQWKGLLQAAIGLTALAFVLSRISFKEIAPIIARVDLSMLLWAALLNFAMVFLMAVRWRLLLVVKYPDIGSAKLFKHYLIGLFFNMFTPGAIGGDVSRLLAAGSITGDRSFVFASLVLERLVGLCGLVLSGLCGIYLGREYLDHPGVYYGIAAVLTAGLALSSGIFSERFTRFFIDRIIRLEERFNIKLASDYLSRLAGELASFSKHRSTIAASIAFTLLIRFVWVTSCWLTAKAIGIDPPFAILTAFIAIVDIARMAPISLPNGLGVREYLLVLLLGQLGIPAAEALLFSLIAYTMLTINGLIGGALYTAGGAIDSYKK